jgi:hypothetical protein
MADGWSLLASASRDSFSDLTGMRHGAGGRAIDRNLARAATVSGTVKNTPMSACAPRPAHGFGKRNGCLDLFVSMPGPCHHDRDWFMVRSKTVDAYDSKGLPDPESAQPRLTPRILKTSRRASTNQRIRWQRQLSRRLKLVIPA